MKLLDALRALDSLDDEDTIYAAVPWTEDSEAAVEREPESGATSVEAGNRSLKSFLEVIVARQFLEDWSSGLKAQPTLQQKCARLIEYAINDA